MNDFYNRREKLNLSLIKLEQSNDSNLYINYRETVKKNTKAYRISYDIISKLQYEASWGDKHDRISSIIDSLNTTTDNFLKKIKFVSCNVYGSDIIYGPIKGQIVSSRDSENNWYNILKNLLKLSNRVNEHYIAKYERELIKMKEEKEKLEKKNNEKLLKTQKMEEQEELQQSIKEFLQDDTPDNWDD